MLGSNPGLLRLWYWQSVALTTWLDLIHNIIENNVVSDTWQNYGKIFGITLFTNTSFGHTTSINTHLKAEFLVVIGTKVFLLAIFKVTSTK
jgi:hypothetical protein